MATALLVACIGMVSCEKAEPAIKNQEEQSESSEQKKPFAVTMAQKVSLSAADKDGVALPYSVKGYSGKVDAYFLEEVEGLSLSNLFESESGSGKIVIKTSVTGKSELQTKVVFVDERSESDTLDLSVSIIPSVFSISIPDTKVTVTYGKLTEVNYSAENAYGSVTVEMKDRESHENFWIYEGQYSNGKGSFNIRTSTQVNTATDIGLVFSDQSGQKFEATVTVTTSEITAREAEYISIESTRYEEFLMPCDGKWVGRYSGGAYILSGEKYETGFSYHVAKESQRWLNIYFYEPYIYFWRSSMSPITEEDRARIKVEHHHYAETNTGDVKITLDNSQGTFDCYTDISCYFSYTECGEKITKHSPKHCWQFWCLPKPFYSRLSPFERITQPSGTDHAEVHITFARNRDDEEVVSFVPEVDEACSSWVSVTDVKREGPGDYYYIINIAQNESSQAREGQIKFWNGAHTAYMPYTIKQKAPSGGSIEDPVDGGDHHVSF